MHYIILIRTAWKYENDENASNASIELLKSSQDTRGEKREARN